MIRILLLLLSAVRALIRRRSDLVLENLALRQQVAALAAKRKRARIAAVAGSRRSGERPPARNVKLATPKI